MADSSDASKRPTIAEAIRRWLDENEAALRIVKGSGQLVISVTFDTNTNAAKVRWGM